MNIRTLVVDAEPLASQRIRLLLEEEPDVEVVGECGDGFEAVDQIQAARPDLVFLDVQMGDPPTTVDYSKALDLTSYDGSTVTVNNTTWSKRGIKDMTAGYRSNPDSSPILSMTRIQANGNVIHPGGAFWKTGDGDYKALRQWISEGASDD